MFQQWNMRLILRTFFHGAGTCISAFLLTGADVRAQAVTQVAPFSLIAAELDLLVSEKTRAAKVDGVGYFVIDDRSCGTRARRHCEGVTGHCSGSIRERFSCCNLKGGPFDPLKELVGKVLVLRLSTCGSGAYASCGHRLQSIPPKLVQSWRPRR